MNLSSLPVLSPGFWAAAVMIAAVVLSSTAGEVLTAAAMKSIGDLDEIRAHSGLKGAIRAVLTSPLFFTGVGFLALAFFSLLFSLNHLPVSLVAPAAQAEQHSLKAHLQHLADPLAGDALKPAQP